MKNLVLIAIVFLYTNVSYGQGLPTFTPALVDGEPVRIQYNVSINADLQ